MPDMYMDVDVALSEVPINKLPLIDDTDFKSREESVVYNQAGLDLVWNFITTAGAFTQTAVTPTDTDGDYDWVNQGNGMYSIEIPASGGASINNDTEGFGWFTGFATGILPWAGPVIGFRATALNNALIDGGDYLQVDLLQINGISVVGNLATLTLKQLDIQNNAGSALVAKSTGGDGHGVEAAGNGTGEGINALGGATGDGIRATGGATSGSGLYAEATTEGKGIIAVAKGTDEHGILAIGGDTSGHGIYAYGTLGASAGIKAIGGPTGHGLDVQGGVTSGDGLHAGAQAGNGNGISAVKHGTGKDIDADEIDTIDTVVDGIQTDLSNATDGLGALKALIDAVKTVVDAIPTTAMRGTDNAALASVVGALNDVAAAGEVTDADTIMQYIKQLINILIGAAGIAAFPAEAAPANAVSLAEVIRAIHADVTGLNGEAMRGTDGANTVVPDAAGTAATPAEVATALTNYDPPTKAELDTAVETIMGPDADDIKQVILNMAALNNISPAQVNEQVLDVLNVDTFPEPAQGAPPATCSLITRWCHLYKAWRNKKITDATGTEIYNDAGAVVDHKRAHSDDGTDYTKEEVVSGP